MAGHLGSFGRALAASTRRRRFGAEGAFDQLANCLRAAGGATLTRARHILRADRARRNLMAFRYCFAHDFPRQA
jgi:hypothetical protein